MVRTVTALFALVIGVQAPPELRVTLVGNAGVVVSDGVTSLLVDLPYESGAFGYMHYEPGSLNPAGTVVSVITHHHRDHFAPEHFLARREWKIVGPASVTGSVPATRVLVGDSLRIGAFDVVSIPTPHTDDHRSYRVRWRGRVLVFPGDTEAPAVLGSGPAPDLLFITPWLSCAATEARMSRLGDRVIAYHLNPGGGDQLCGVVERLAQGVTITLGPGGG